MQTTTFERWFLCFVSSHFDSKISRLRHFSLSPEEKPKKMGKITFRVVIGILVVLLLYYVGRPLYWKISATVVDIRHNKQTVSEGFSQIVQAAQNSVGWFHDESDSGVRDVSIAAARRILLRKVL